MKSISLLLFVSLFLFTAQQGFAQKKRPEAPIVEPIDSRLFDSLEFRSIGPAFMSGRIADIAIDPTNENVWYVAVGSGGVWKTINAGTTFEPLFDDQPVYSIGCVTLDPNNPYTFG
jgi:hypothetical protein